VRVTPIAAGTVRMRYRLTVPFNVVVGGLVWVWGSPSLGICSVDPSPIWTDTCSP